MKITVLHTLASNLYKLLTQPRAQAFPGRISGYAPEDALSTSYLGHQRAYRFARSLSLRNHLFNFMKSLL